VGERTSYEPGTFSWVDLGTTDTDSAKGFYAGLFGWDFEDLPVGEGGNYTICRVDGMDVCAIAEQSEQERGQGVPPHWNNYVTVDDIDAQAPRIGELNGNLILPPFDVLEAGRMALGTDPTGGVFALWEPRNHIGAGLVNAPGALAWNELATGDKAAAEEFYGALFGWTFDEIEDSPVPYAVIKNGNRSNGGIRAQGDAEKGMPPYWAPYFGVVNSEESAAKASELGGQVVVPSTRMPAGAFAGIADPQGAFFLIFEGDFDD
jgi:predicted enzyme related to lactoylglutathione lyase